MVLFIPKKAIYAGALAAALILLAAAAPRPSPQVPAAASAAPSRPQTMLVLDAGHGGEDGGAVSVTDSDCPTQDCVHTGAISRAGQSIVCLPAQVVVHLEGASVPDAPDVIVG